MTRLPFLLPLLLAFGCDKGPLMKCDYCRTPRYEVLRYMCDKCKKPHAACDAEKCILSYTKTEAIRGGIYYSATGILTCPATPEDIADAAPVSETSAQPSPEELQQLTTTQRTILVTVLVIGTLLLGYAMGKARRGQLIKLENKKGIVS